MNNEAERYTVSAGRLSALYSSAIEYFMTALKMGVYLNGGAVIVTIGFAGALIGSERISETQNFAKSMSQIGDGAQYFVFGMFSASSGYILGYFSQIGFFRALTGERGRMNTAKHHDLFYRLAIFSVAASLGSFLIGSMRCLEALTRMQGG